MSWPDFDADRVRKDFLSAERFAGCCDQAWSRDRRSTLPSDRLNPGQGWVVYAKRDHTPLLFKKLEQGRNRIVLVTSESDDAVDPGGPIPRQVAHWFSTNSRTPGVSPLPLGLGNSYCKVTAKAGLLADFSAREKKSLLYVNFRPETNPGVRLPLWETFGSSEWTGCCTRQPGNVSGEEYVASMASHKFVLCPRGNGIDTHRMWEALYLGVIPIVEKNSALEGFRDLPILFVDHLEGLKRGFLESKYQDIISSGWNYEKLFLPWWENCFRKEQNKIGAPVPFLDYWCAKLGACKPGKGQQEQKKR